MDEMLLIQLSAYADGEADAATARALEERLAGEPELRRVLAEFMALDLAAQREAIPAPAALDPNENDNAELLRTARGDMTPAEAKLEAAARAMPVPAVKAEAFDAAWMAIARRVESERSAMEVMALDDGERDTVLDVPPEFNGLRRAWQILDKSTQRMDAPELGAERGAQAWITISLETVAVPEQHGAWVEMLEAAARAIPAPQPSTEQFDARWKAVAAALQPSSARPTPVNLEKADPVPAVSEQKWDSVWGEIRRQTSTHPGENVVVADFSENRKKTGWRWGVVAAMSLAAAAVAMVLTVAPQPDPDVKPLAMASVSVPEIADERYELDLLYLPDQPQPVVTFFLKDEPVASGNFRWMPE